MINFPNITNTLPPPNHSICLGCDPCCSNLSVVWYGFYYILFFLFIFFFFLFNIIIWVIVGFVHFGLFKLIWHTWYARFRTLDPDQAHLFFIPISCHKMRGKVLCFSPIWTVLYASIENVRTSWSFCEIFFRDFRSNWEIKEKIFRHWMFYVRIFFFCYESWISCYWLQ